MKAPLSKSDSLRILHLEDNPIDGEVTRAALKLEWPRIEIDRAESREAFLAALTGGNFDLILSDQTIPGFSGMAGLELARQHKPDVPYVFYSGTIGEDKALEALKRGATDYVIKDRPKRLIPAIRRALEQSDQRREKAFVLIADRIAHNFSNAFGPILWALPLIREQPIDDRTRSLLDAVEISARRGADLTRQLQAFTRGEKGDFCDVEPEMKEAPKGQSDPKTGRKRTILVIDDEDCVCKVVGGLLEGTGQYQVILSRNAADGLAAYRSRRGEIQAVLTDVTLPDASGTQVVREIRAINPAAGIVVMSGLDKPEDLAEEPGGLVFLRKPMTRADLLQALQEVLPVRCDD
jgi:DNA-binding NtrC family response regulator